MGEGSLHMGESTPHLIWEKNYKAYSTQRLEELTRSIDKVSLELLEVPHKDTSYYFLNVYSKDGQLAIIHLGLLEKKTTRKDCTLPEMADALHVRASLARTLGVPDYTPAEEIVAFSFMMGQRSPAQQHLSPADEGKLVKLTIECAEAIGLAKIKNIGQLQPSIDKLLQAKEYLSSN